MPTASYANTFRKVLVSSTDLLKPGVIEAYKAKGLTWIRRVHKKHFEDIVRRPTIGAMYELCYLQDVGCIPLDSPKAAAMIKKLCYF
jgi:hypothetical protein